MPPSSPPPTTNIHVDPSLWRIWAKWPRTPNVRRYHPLLCHMLDVASAMRLLWPRALTPTQRARIAAALGLPESDTKAWFVFWAGLHDIGKASPAFQTQLRAKNPTDGQIIDSWLDDAGLNTLGARWAPHGAISLILMETLLPEAPYGCDPSLVQQIAAIVGAHHGLFFTELQLADFSRPDLKGDDTWKPTQQALTAHLAAALGGLPPSIPQGMLTSGDAMALAGLVSVADWIGSNANRFPLAAGIPASPPADLAAYASLSLRCAEAALADVLWDSADLANTPRAFSQLFPQIRAPRAVQQSVIEIADRLDEPGLVIVEVPMGEGKTEAAMYLADQWSVRLGQRGVYFALPTQATSNQMFGRIQRFLGERFTDQYVNLHLAHGMSALSDQYQQLQLDPQLVVASLYDKDSSGAQDDAEHGAVIAAGWFAESKRALLSSYGVGTIDQALLAVLQVKHGFVRLFGLSGKTVIIDEVHAYDVYMSTLLESLLEWLGAMQAPVVLLSATLPATRRHRLLKHYARGAGWPAPTLVDAPYPRVTYASAKTAASVPITATAKARTLQLQWVNGALPTEGESSFHLAERLAHALHDGGCAAVVCNTVRRAQDMYRALDLAFARLPAEDRPSLRLLHAQFIHEDRRRHEQFVLDTFGLAPDGARNPNRPHRAVLVATQVIEQSLDLDFDLMVSDLAPIDLLLQRAGRVHRHDVNTARPKPVHQPTLWICQPTLGEDGVPVFSRSDTFVYDAYILLHTWSALRSANHIAIPDAIEGLIETVYTDDLAIPQDADEALAARLRQAWPEMRRPQFRAVSEANSALIPSPWQPDIYTHFNSQLEEDNPEAHAKLQARTRDGEPTLPVILLDPHEPRLKRSATPSRDEARKLLGRSINITRQGLLKALLAQEQVPSGWARSPWLRHYRAITLDTDLKASYRAVNGDHTFTLHLHPTLGVVIEKH